MYLYFVLQGKVCDCDVSAIDCSVGLGTRWVRQGNFFVDFFSKVHIRYMLSPVHLSSVCRLSVCRL